MFDRRLPVPPIEHKLSFAPCGHVTRRWVFGIYNVIPCRLAKTGPNCQIHLRIVW